MKALRREAQRERRSPHGHKEAARCRLLSRSMPARSAKRIDPSKVYPLRGGRLSSIITLEDLHYAYPSPVPGREPVWILRGVDLEVKKGEFLSIMGPTGVGKSTLCLALNGIVPQSTGGLIRGEVRVEGLDTKRHPIPELAKRVGLVFQDAETQLFNMTVEAEVAFGLENLGVPSQEIEERMDWALRMVGMKGFRQRSPFQLSGGEKQRVAIASILAMMPKVLVLDEPTANLDPVGKAEVFSVVRQLHRERGMTIIMVEHESEYVAEFSDRLVVLADGRVALEGAPRRIFAQINQMREIGLAVPQVSELADCLNRNLDLSFRFTRLEAAERALRDQLDGRS